MLQGIHRSLDRQVYLILQPLEPVGVSRCAHLTVKVNLGLRAAEYGKVPSFSHRTDHFYQVLSSAEMREAYDPFLSFIITVDKVQKAFG